jgi:3,4-dihydroxy 2-butanone 4-phosphate synthase/GTP cyclohydrolase II
MTARKLTLAKHLRPQAPFGSIEDALDAYRRGEMLIVVDDEDRENEGDLTMAADRVTPDAVNFMARYGRGLICLAMMPDRLNQLEIPLEVSHNAARRVLRDLDLASLPVRGGRE